MGFTVFVRPVDPTHPSGTVRRSGSVMPVRPGAPCSVRIVRLGNSEYRVFLVQPPVPGAPWFTLCSLFTKPGQTEKPGTAIYRQFTRLRQIGHRRTPRYLLHKVRQGAKGEVFGLWAYGVIGAKACGISRLWGVRCVRLRIGVSAGWKVKSRARQTSQGIAKNNRGIWPLVFRIARLVYANR